MDNQDTVYVTPHWGQAKLLTSPKRFLLAIAGIQGGKTFIGCIWIHMEIAKYPDKNHLICALSQDQLNNVVLDKFFSMFPSYKNYYVKKDKTIYLPTGGKIFFRSLEEPKYVEGITAHSAWIDEADLCGYRAYLIVRGRLNATGGRLLMTSSLADNSWLAEYAERFSENDFEIVNWKSKDNPAFLDWEGLKAELDPMLFKRRYEADLNMQNGKVYATFDKNRHVVSTFPKDEIITKTFIGIDWGYVDPTAIVVLGLTSKKNFYVLADFMVEGTPMDLIVKAVTAFKDTYGVRLFFADPSNKSMLESVKSKIGADIVPGTRDIFYGTSIIRSLMHQNRFYVMERCTHVLGELKRYSFIRGLLNYTEEPEDKNNHSLDAIRYILATYPIPSLRYKKEEEPKEISPFWARRSPAYRKATRQLEAQRTFDPNNVILP